jgi:hypothetical protein
MTKDPMRPKWWILYLIIGSILGLFWLEAKAALSDSAHTIIEVSLVIILYCLVIAWLQANEVALLMEEREKNRKRAIQNTATTGHPIVRNTVNVEESRNGKLVEQANRLQRPILPAWLMALAAIIVDFFESKG